MQYGDIIQADFLDTYRNLSLKDLALLEWTILHCPDVPFIFKGDDDIFLNVDNLVTLSQNKTKTTICTKAS